MWSRVLGAGSMVVASMWSGGEHVEFRGCFMNHQWSDMHTAVNAVSIETPMVGEPNMWQFALLPRSSIHSSISVSRLSGDKFGLEAWFEHGKIKSVSMSISTCIIHALLIFNRKCPILYPKYKYCWFVATIIGWPACMVESSGVWFVSNPEWLISSNLCVYKLRTYVYVCSLYTICAVCLIVHGRAVHFNHNTVQHVIPHLNVACFHNYSMVDVAHTWRKSHRYRKICQVQTGHVYMWRGMPFACSISGIRCWPYFVDSLCSIHNHWMCTPAQNLIISVKPVSMCAPFT